MVEHLVANENVEGSNPFTRSNLRLAMRGEGWSVRPSRVAHSPRELAKTSRLRELCLFFFSQDSLSRFQYQGAAVSRPPKAPSTVGKPSFLGWLRFAGQVGSVGLPMRSRMTSPAKIIFANFGVSAFDRSRPVNH